MSICLEVGPVAGVVSDALRLVLKDPAWAGPLVPQATGPQAATPATLQPLLVRSTR
jgi:hypothetical protein